MKTSVALFSILFVVTLYQCTICAEKRSIFWTNAQKSFFGYQQPTIKQSQPLQDEKNITHPWVDILLYGSVEKANGIREQREQQRKAEREKWLKEIELRKLIIKEKEIAQAQEQKLYYEKNKERLEKQAERLKQIEEFLKQRTKKSQ